MSMRRLNVRCCCDGVKILGTLELPEHEIKAMVKIHRPPVREFSSYKDFDPDAPVLPITAPPPEYIEIKRFRNADGTSEDAVYSDDRPIEYWRTVPGFREVK